MKDRIPDLQALIEDGKLEKSLRKLAEEGGQVTFSMSLSPSQSTYSFSATNADNSTENYSNTTPFVPSTQSPLPPGETA